MFEADTSLPCDVVPAVNYNGRKAVRHPDILLLHYTGMETGKAALDWLVCEESQVSCHYLIEEDGGIFQMVAERHRAWHAGKSCWEKCEDINSRSIGIEIVNPGHEFGYRPFADCQINSAIKLGLDIAKRHKIGPTRVLAHSDVAPGRKSDPGELFPWNRLSSEGLGHYVNPIPVGGDTGLDVGSEGNEVRSLQQGLQDYGYGIEVSGGYCDKTKNVTAAFQRHFRQELVNGMADRSTIGTLRELLAAAKNLRSTVG